MLSFLFIGFLLGMKHAFEADHLAAVASLTRSESSMKQAIRLGVAWGLGHTITLFAVVFLVLLLGEGMPEGLTQALEMIVGVMLILLGADVLQRLAQVHFHAHRHDGSESLFMPTVTHWNEGQHSNSPHNHDHQISWRALAVGLVHGLAGSAALVVLTVATTESLWLGMVYTALFGVGSILGMATLSIVIAVPLGICGRRLSKIHDSAMLIIGFTTIVIGGTLLVNNVIEAGIFM